MYKQEWRLSTLILSLIILCVGGIGYHLSHLKASVVSQVQAQAISTPAPVIPTDFVNYVKFKFGPDADKAFLLLQGSSKCQGENPTFNPNASCNNTLWGGIGIDRGYWQINTVFHPDVSDWCAKDVVCSTNYVYRMWKNDGNTFSKRWTAGKCLKGTGFDI
jgi:hypothetical protein